MKIVSKSDYSDLKNIINEYICIQFRRNQEISFNHLSRSQKREIAVYELINPLGDGLDMIINHEGIQITRLLFDWLINKKRSARRTLYNLIDSIIERYTGYFEKLFQNEVGEYLLWQSNENESLWKERNNQEGALL